jgi:thioredoxin 1
VYPDKLRKYVKPYQLAGILITIFCIFSSGGLGVGLYEYYNALSPHDQLQKDIVDAGDHLVIVEFGADWCGPCGLMEKNITDLQQCMEDVIILHSDVVKDPKSADEYQIDAVPTFKFVFHNETINDRVRGRSFEELAHKTFKYYEKYVKKFIPPSNCSNWNPSSWVMCTRYTCCSCPEGCEPIYNTTPIDKCLKNATLTRHRKFDKKTKLPLSEVKKYVIPNLAKIPRSKHVLSENPSSNFKVQANQNNVKEIEISPLETQPQKKTIRENHKNHNHNHKIPRTDQIVPETPNSNSEVQDNPEKVEVDKISPLKTLAQEKELVENDKLIQDFVKFAKLPHLEQIVPDNTNTQKSSQDSQKSTSENISDDSLKKLKSFKEFNEKKRKRNLTKLPHLEPKGPETLSSISEVQSNPEKVEVDKVSPLKTLAHQKEIVGNDKMNQEILKFDNVPFPEPNVPETASFNFELQENPEKVKVEKNSPLKTPGQEKESVENDKLIQDFVNFAKLPHLEPAVPDTTNKQKSSQDSLKSTSKYNIDNSSKKLESLSEAEKKRIRNQSFHKLDQLPHYPPAHKAATFTFEKNGSAEITQPKPAVGFPGFPGLLSSLLAQQRKG